MNKIKIIYVLRFRLHQYPPCVSQIRILKELGFDVTVLYGICDENTLKILKNESIKCVQLTQKYDKVGKKFNKLFKFLDILRFRKLFKKELKKYEDYILWIGNVETALDLIGLLKNRRYILSSLELYDSGHDKYKKFMIKNIIKNAYGVTCCEETRAYIMQYWYKLAKLPYVFPNKPYNLPYEKRTLPTTKYIENIVEKIKNKPVIIYQRPSEKTTNELIEFAKALNYTKKKYTLLLLGTNNKEVIDEVKKYYTNIISTKFIPSPLYLQITSYARIGIVFYSPTCLNHAFCAPNKTYEYTGFGVPVICNKLPGLENTIGKYGAGKCINLVSNEISKTIDEIDDNYDNYEKNAYHFFDSCDNLETMKKMLTDLELYSIEDNGRK